MTIILSEKLKAVSKDGPPLDTALPRSTELPPDAVQLRYLGSSRDFVRTVNCYPGYITVIQEGEQEPFREALLGKDRTGSVSLRSVSQELHSSEIYVVQITEPLLKSDSVEQYLRSSGAPAADIPDVLKSIGLEGAGALPPREFGTAALKRITVACSAYARARLLLFDRPFAGADPAWVERIAQLLLQIGETNARIMVVTGESRLPQLWRSNARVLIQDPSRSQLALPGIQGDAKATVQEAARNLMQASVLVQQRVTEIVTRPQMIRGGNRPQLPEALQSEAISNPNVALPNGAAAAAGGGDLSQLSTEAAQSVRRDGTEENQMNEFRRSKTGNLTRVNTKDRFSQTWLGDIWGDTMRKMRARFSARPVELDMPPSARMVEHKKRKDLRLGVIIFIVAVLAACLLQHYARK